MHHGDVPSGKVVVSRLMGQEDQRKERRTEPDRCKLDLGTLGFRMSEGTKKRGSVFSDVSEAQQRRE